MQRTFLYREFLIPGCEVHHGYPEVAEGTPKDPPAVTQALLNTTIRARASVKRTWDVKQIIGHRGLHTPGHCSAGHSAGSWDKQRSPRDFEGCKRVLLVEQVLLAEFDERIQPLLPVSGDPAGIFSCGERVQNGLIHQQVSHTIKFEIVWIELMQRGG